MEPHTVMTTPRWLGAIARSWRRASVRRAHVVQCPACELAGQPAGPRLAAEQLARVHDRFHHHGKPTATVR
jgi:hypothetical protein